jgi:hypothetical protein
MILIIRFCFGAYQDSRRQAEYILDVIEREGMLPPVRKNDYILENTDWDDECDNCEEEE